VTRLCAWCKNSIPAKARRDAVCCSVRCRPAQHRFLRAVGYAEAVPPGRPLRLAYADPPYPGKAWLYRDHPDYRGPARQLSPAAGICPMTVRAVQGMARVRSGQAPACGPGPLPLSPIGLTAADLFAGGKVSRVASRARCPAGRP